MPTIHRAGAFRINIYAAEHGVPHFHIVTPDHEASVAIETLEILAGAVPAAVRRRALAWAAENQPLLMEKWHEYTGS